MECLQLPPGQAPSALCHMVLFFINLVTWVGTHTPWWVMGALGALILFYVLWNNYATVLPTQIEQTPKARAEALLRESVTTEQYQHLLHYGYLEMASRLYPNRRYHIPHDRRRVQVFEFCATNPGQQPQKLGELCVIACEPMPDADLVLTHKWLIEADEQKYLSIANWVK